MTFDACEYKIRQIVIKAAIHRRIDIGLPEERNITTLYNEMAPLLGVLVIPLDSRMVNHLPSPAEMKNEKGEFVVPRKDCPKCVGKETMLLTPLCKSCEDAEGGKYKTAWICQTCQNKEKSEKFFTQWLNELGVEIPEGMKQAMGIKTLTDTGFK
jgi:hypothetical protein